MYVWSCLRGLSTDVHQTKPLIRLVKLKRLFSFDFSAATDRIPLSVQGAMVSALLNDEVSLSYGWVRSGLGVNAFLASTSIKEK